MKKRISAFAVVLCLAALLCTPALGAAETVSFGGSVARSGDEVRVSVTLDRGVIHSAQLSVSYDADSLELADAQYGQSLEHAAIRSLDAESQAGLVEAAFASTQPVPQGSLLELTFRSLDGATPVFQVEVAEWSGDGTPAVNHTDYPAYTLREYVPIPGGATTTYPVKTAGQPENGSVRIDAGSAAPGQTVTITAVPDAGYLVGSVTVTDGSGAAVAVIDNGDGTWSFVMPEGGVTVSANFITPGQRFQDVNDQGWYRNAIAFMVSRGLMKGVEADTFAPDATTTRGMIATILHRMAGSPAAQGEDFSDVSAGQWFAPAVAWASAEGVVQGYGDGTFGPDDHITREQLAVMLWRNAGSPDSSAGLDRFPDAGSVSGYARTAIAWAVEKGILNGKDGALVPQGDATRAEAAQMIMTWSLLSKKA